ncbi:MAG: hypothetical protein L0H25_01180 [Micrococcales bacterium]|nr:hypothetical protein [Micrococcales bacterium]
MTNADRSARSVQVSAYHLEVDTAVAELEAALTADADVSEAMGVLDHAFRGPVALEIMDRLPYSRAHLLTEAHRELERPKPGSASNARTHVGLVRILLLHQMDVMWWSEVEPYADDAAVEHAPELRSLPTLQEAGALRFRFATQPDALWGRGRDYMLRRLATRRRPNVSGMKFLVARPEIVAVLNEIADALKRRAPKGTPPLWVNSTVRSVEHQMHLSSLGYSALLPSSHCLGFGADVEMAWFERFGAYDALRAILFDYRDGDVLNIIDEGQAWHLCLSPDHLSAYS